jgi:hypothetical protein
MLNEIYTYTELNREVRLSSVDDIIGYVLNNQREIVTNNLQKYVRYYQSASQAAGFNMEDRFFEGQKRVSALILPVRDH